MSSAIALMFLAQAAACAPTNGIELPGGATIVRPVGTSEPVPFEPLGPSPGVSKPDVIQQADAPAAPEDSPGELSPGQCEVVALQIV